MKTVTSTTFLVTVWLIFILLNVFAVLHIESLANDGINYHYNNGFVIVDYLGVEAMKNYSNIETGDTLFLIDNKRIVNKHYLYNRVFEKHKPGDKLQYTLRKNGELKTATVQLKHYFALYRRLFMYFSSLLLSIVTLILILREKNKATSFSILCLICTVASSLILYINIPFSNQWQYITFIIISSSLIILLYLFSSYIVSYTFNMKVFSILMLILSIPAILWSFFYIQWTMNLSNNTYVSVQLFMKIFHFISSGILIFVIYISMKKLIYAYSKNTGIQSYFMIVSFIVILFLYPVFLALPVIFRSRELLHFEYFFSLLIILPIMSMFKGNNVLYREDI